MTCAKSSRNASLVWCCCLLLAVFLLCSRSVWGQENNSKDRQEATALEEVVVQATRSGTTLEDIPGSATVITREQIESSPYTKVDDMLRSVAGVDIGLHLYVNTQAGVRPANIRGVGGYGDRTLVLIDGIPQNNANNGWVDLSQVPLEWIERIEVLRGPFSALYGSNCMGGVINLITRNPTPKRETSAKVRYGSLESLDSTVTHRQSFGNLGVILGGRYFETDGYKASDPEYPYESDRSKQEENAFAKALYNFSDASKITLGLNGLYSDQNRGREYFAGVTNNWHLYGQYELQQQAYNLKSSLYYNKDEWDVDFDSAPTYSYYDHNEDIHMDSVGMQNQVNVDLAGWNQITAGIDWKGNKMDNDHTYYTTVRDVGSKGKQFEMAFFLQDQMRLFNDKLLFNVGARADYVHNYDGSNFDTKTGYKNKFDSEDWASVNPKLGLSYRPFDTTTLKCSFGTAFKAPSLYELYTSLTRGSIYIEANPNLDPEKIISYDVGIEHWFLDSLVASVTFYQSFAEDYIDYETISKNYWVRDNISQVNIQGVEVQLDYYFLTYWQAHLSYTYNESKIDEYTADPEIEGNYLGETPRNKVGFALYYDRPSWFNAGLIMVYNSKRWADNDNEDELPDYVTVDLKISKTIKNVTFGLEVENLFDEEYLVGSDGTRTTSVPGRLILGSIAFKF